VRAVVQGSGRPGEGGSLVKAVAKGRRGSLSMAGGSLLQAGNTVARLCRLLASKAWTDSDDLRT
jgi:hypothetical protein